MFRIRDWEPLVCKDMELSPRCTKCRTLYVICHQYVEDGKEEENIYIYMHQLSLEGIVNIGSCGDVSWGLGRLLTAYFLTL